MSRFAPATQRPPGYAPKGTSLGLFGLSLLTATPSLSILNLIPVLPDGTDLFLEAMLPNFIAIVPLSVVKALGLHKRRIWYIWFLFGWGIIGITGYVIGMLLLFAVLFRLLPQAHPELRFCLIVGGACWIVLTLAAFWVARMLLLSYWQPWTRPAQWEAGDELPPRWVRQTGR